MPKKASRRRMSTIPMTAANLPIKAARTATRGATNLYKKKYQDDGKYSECLYEAYYKVHV